MSDAHDMDRDVTPFEQLVVMLATSAMQQLGLLIDPRTGKPRQDLAGAEWTIDLLGALEEKTEGRLDANESRALKDALASLRLNFVEAARAGATRPPAEPAADPAGTPPPDQPSAEPGPTAKGGGDEKEPKFHKTYS